MKKRLYLFLTIALLMFGSQMVSATELGTGLAEPEVVGIPVTVAGEDVVDAERVSEIEAETTADTDKWDAYASLYYYNQLSPEYRETWDALDVVCKSYFNASKTVTDENGCIERVALPDGMTMDEMKIFWKIYVYSNPQYYFIKNGYYYYYKTVDDVDYPTSIMLCMYSAFYDGETRAAETEKVEAKLEEWQTEIDACATEAAKLQKMQDLICAKVTYNYDAANDVVDEQVSFSQSPYSVFCGDTTVCAGYADTFYMLCNASGIDAISVTSSNHQWNKVRVNDSWYNFDVTWDDNYTDSWGYSVYKYYGRSDAMYDTDIGSNDASSIASHQEENYWAAYIPVCTLDSAPDSSFKVPGAFATISAQTAMPEIAVSYVTGQPVVELGCTTENAVIYYTTDGTNPSVAKNKSNKYSAAFAAEVGTQVKAIAVCDMYLDSAVASKTIELEKYAITYVMDGGVNHTDNPAYYTILDEISLQVPAKAGYKFVGWYTDETGLQETTGIASGSTGERTFYAVWSPITYTISFDGNGATGGTMPAKTGCEYDTSYTLATNNFTRTGYTFTGWNTDADGNGTPYADKATVLNLTESDGENITLYAQWTPVSYSVAFDGNGATSGSMESQSNCKYDTSYTLPLNNYAKTGYTFAGWNTDADGNGTLYANQTSVKNLSATDGATVTLYAQWTPVSYTIAYDGNGATSGTMSQQSGCKYDTTCTLVANNFKKTGYKFAGWKMQGDENGSAYADKASVKNLSATDKATVTLYAQWTPISYNIAFDGNGQTGGSMTAISDCEYDTSYTLPLNNYAKTGYTFVGWNTDADGNGVAYTDGASVKNMTATNGEEVTLYAQWTPITYTLVFAGNGAETGVVADMTCAYDKAYALNKNTYEKKWYAFVGWNTEEDGSGTWYTDGEMIKNLTTTDGDTITLYAQWFMTTYHIAFDGNGATTGSMDTLSDCKYDFAYELAANNFAKTGYVFTGWNTNPDGSGTSYVDEASVMNLTNEDGATVTLYAQWTPITYKIVYKGNGATSGITATTSYKYDSTYTLPVANYMRTGYTFKGWNTKADGSGRIYADKAQVKNLSATEGAEIILYAQWTANTYTIKYNGNKATSGNMSAQTLLLYDKNYTLSANKFKRTGYKFTGWNTKKNGKGISYKNKASVKNLSSVNGAVITLYAQWKANTYKVKFNGNGATGGSMKKMTKLSYGKKYKLSANKFKKTGYKFVGWNTKKNGKGKMYKNKAKIKNLTPKNGKTITLYAQWKKIK